MTRENGLVRGGDRGAGRINGDEVCFTDAAASNLLCQMRRMSVREIDFRCHVRGNYSKFWKESLGWVYASVESTLCKRGLYLPLMSHLPGTIILRMPTSSCSVTSAAPLSLEIGRPHRKPACWLVHGRTRASMPESHRPALSMSQRYPPLHKP